MRQISANLFAKLPFRRLLANAVIPLVLASGLLLQTGASGAEVIINLAPPRAVVETPPPSPGPLWVWDPGYHAWRGGKYVWVPGHYIKKPRPTAKWVPGHYVQRPKGWVWVPGHWA